jgi:hypothetical protein
LPDRAEEIDPQFHSSKGFLWSESTCKRYTHCGISNIAKNSAMQRSHGICVLWSGCQDDRGPSSPLEQALPWMVWYDEFNQAPIHRELLGIKLI